MFAVNAFGHFAGSANREIYHPLDDTMETEMDWTEYERRKRELPPMDPEEYTEAVKMIVDELGI